MAEKDMKRFVWVKLRISDDCTGKYVCSKCKAEKPWNGENYTELRCINLNCNSIMNLNLMIEEVKNMLGSHGELERKDCPKGQKGKGGEILKVSIDTRGCCNMASICKIACKHKKS